MVVAAAPVLRCSRDTEEIGGDSRGPTPDYAGDCTGLPPSESMRRGARNRRQGEACGGQRPAPVRPRRLVLRRRDGGSSRSDAARTQLHASTSSIAGLGFGAIRFHHLQNFRTTVPRYDNASMLHPVPLLPLIAKTPASIATLGRLLSDLGRTYRAMLRGLRRSSRMRAGIEVAGRSTRVHASATRGLRRVEGHRPC